MELCTGLFFMKYEGLDNIMSGPPSYECKKNPRVFLGSVYKISNAEKRQKNGSLSFAKNQKATTDGLLYKRAKLGTYFFFFNVFRKNEALSESVFPF